MKLGKNSMKPAIAQKLYFFSKVLLLLLSSSLIYSNLCYSDQKSQKFIDDFFYFSVQLPHAWNTEQIKNDSSFLRLKSLSPEGKYLFAVYSFRIKEGDVSLEKLAEYDRAFFANLGKFIANKPDKHSSFWVKTKYRLSKIKKWIVDGVKNIFGKKKIEKIYNNENIWTKLIFRTDACYGYILMCKCFSNDFSNFIKIEKTFDTNVSFLTAIKNRLPGFYQYMAILLIFASFYPIGLTGKLVREGLIYK